MQNQFIFSFKQEMVRMEFEGKAIYTLNDYILY